MDCIVTVLVLQRNDHAGVASAGEHSCATTPSDVRMLALEHPLSGGRVTRLHAGLARSAAEIEAAQRLRYRVFKEELGANVRAPASRPGHDCDFFDPWCEHLVATDVTTGAIVGTYRMLTPERAKRLGTFYADTEFDLVRLSRLRADMLEIGRACIDPAWRNGATLLLLWQCIARFMREQGYQYVIGCASMPMTDGGILAIDAFRRLERRALAPIEYRVTPRHPLEGLDAGASGAPRAGEEAIPPLIRAYVRMGAWIGGDPAWDPDFNTADLFMLLPLARLCEFGPRRLSM